MQFKHIEHKEINKILWEKKILNAFNGNLYGYAWYLDIVSPQWNAIVSSDYEVIVPLPVKNFLGFHAIQQPLFCQQLGIYCTKPKQLSYTEEILSIIKKNYSYCYLQLNKYNIIHQISFGEITQRVNYELDLISPYNYLWQKFSENTRRNILKSYRNNLSLTYNTIDHQTFLNFLRNNVGQKLPELKNKHYEIILKLLKITEKYKFGERYAVYNANNKLLAIAYFIFSHNKAYYLFGASNNEGKETSAMFFLFDSFIKRYAQKHVTLDFEGSVIPGLARFYQGFGAIPTTYRIFHYNNFPFFIQWFKK
ncbi:MAG: hypothetical protein N2449_02545 [Bacteroidales bacterium]|nr:hypothetical protein [Bacteroidales bacterium]